MTGPASSEPYFRLIDEFVAATLGENATHRYKIIVDDPKQVAKEMLIGLGQVRDFRKHHGDAYYFNWRLKIDHDFQKPFVANHETMRSLEVDEDLPVHELAVNLRRVFSGIVSGNVREDTIATIENQGPFEITGSRHLMKLLDGLLSAFVKQGRMKIASESYSPCYHVTR
jgi:hypothetical protein